MKEKTINDNLYTSLKELGLTDLEISLYTISLELGPSPISEIAKHLEINRPNVYKVIKSLEEHGLVQFSNKEKYNRDFMVEPPTVVLDLIRKKKEEIAKIDNELVSDIPNLLSKYHQGRGDTKIKVLKGKEQYIKIFNQSVEEEGSEIQFCGSAKDFIDFVSWDVEKNWRQKRLTKDIKMKVLTLIDDAFEDLISKDEEENRKTKGLLVDKQFSSSFMLYSNKMILWQPKAPLAVIVEDQYIVEMMRELFKLLWKQN